jgi:hypothetical protein
MDCIYTVFDAQLFCNKEVRVGIVTEEEVQSKATPASLYDRDFFEWTAEQAKSLTERRFEHLDIDRLTEEILDMGNEQVAALESALTEALLHLLKLAYSPAKDPRNGWKNSVRKQRIAFEKRVKRSPSLKSKIDGLFDEAWSDARELAIGDLEEYGEIVQMPDQCPFTLDQLRNKEFWPGEESSPTPPLTKGLGR